MAITFYDFKMAPSPRRARIILAEKNVPPIPGSYFYPAFLADAPDKFDGPIIVGEDGMLFSLPAGMTSIEQTQLK